MAQIISKPCSFGRLWLNWLGGADRPLRVFGRWAHSRRPLGQTVRRNLLDCSLDWNTRNSLISVDPLSGFEEFVFLLSQKLQVAAGRDLKLRLADRRDFRSRRFSGCRVFF